MKPGIFSLRRLRWKLALSYTLVTVLALLVAELILVSVLIAFLISPVIPSLAARYVGDEIAPRLEFGLTQSPPDVESLREEIGPFTRETNVRMADGEGGMDFTLGADDGYLLVVDEERQLLVSSRRTGGFSEGERFDPERFPGLGPLLRAALEGEEDPWSLGAYSPGRGQMLAVAPVEGDGRVLGAVLVVIQLPNLTGPLLAFVAVGALALTIPAAVLGMVFGFLTAWGMTRRLQRLARAAQAWSRGDFSVAVKERSKDEIGQLSRELNQMAAQLEGLIQARQELATLETRNRFARDLHDSVKQQVFATSFQIAAARALIEDTRAAEVHLTQAEELALQAQRELNVLIRELRPAALEGKGLSSALRDYVEDWSRRAEIPAEVHARGEREVPLEVEQTLFRVAQEALANVAKHSDAGNVEVDLIYAPDTLMLRVADDGRGFDPAKGLGEGFGLQSMRERLEKLGGRVEVESAPGKGTRITCVCPLEDSSKDKRP
ncbi:MAG: HAMP domain-containing protein [Actinomycetota bacterium]|nr:HAMP domain-containing protein [Actinomycetota bacterium]